MMFHKWIAIFFILMCVCLSHTQDCTRNEDGAREDDPTRECRKLCANDAACTNSNKTCLCDDLCGMSCFNPDAECPDLTGSLANGVVTMPNGREYNDKAKHSCNTDYVRVGIEKRICRSTRKWSHTAPNCTRSCPAPLRLGNGYPNVDPSETGLYVPGDTVTYSCRTGYDGTGSMVVTCKTNYQWSTAEFVCRPKNCGTPVNIQNGYFEGTNFLFGGTVTYYCDKGYDISGQTQRRCMAAGDWEPRNARTTCSPVTCPYPQTPANGVVDRSSAASQEYNNVIEYSCIAGYKLDGPIQGTCNENGTWGEVPTCIVDLACGFSDRNNPLCGYTIIEGTATRQRTEEDITGFSGYVLYLSGKIQSLAYPLVDSGDLCMSVDFKDTTLAELMANAYNSATSTPMWESSATTSWKTEKFRIRKDNNTEVKVEFVSSSHAKLDNIKQLAISECVGLGICPNPVLEHGSVSPSKQTYYDVDQKVTFSCDTYYKINGATEATCSSDGTWGAAPICVSAPTTTKPETTAASTTRATPTTAPTTTKPETTPASSTTTTPTTDSATFTPATSAPITTTIQPTGTSPVVSIVIGILISLICIMLIIILIICCTRHRKRKKNAARAVETENPAVIVAENEENTPFIDTSV